VILFYWLIRDHVNGFSYLLGCNTDNSVEVSADLREQLTQREEKRCLIRYLEILTAYLRKRNVDITNGQPEWKNPKKDIFYSIFRMAPKRDSDILFGP